MYGAPVSNTLSFTKILGGLSKTLSVANQVIPLYKQAKPLINNLGSVKTIFKTFTQNNSNSQSSTTTSKNNSNIQNTSSNEEIDIPNLPTFFK